MQSKGFCGAIFFGDVIPGQSKGGIRGEGETDLGGCIDNQAAT